ncbi:MAG: F0F1 ATP synthase subunit A [Pirellulales bacterium]|nr:F0F1 ATP synthase subunit A [Planctomycetales bacterium]
MADAAHTIGHVKDSTYFEVPNLFGAASESGHGAGPQPLRVDLPQPFQLDKPILGVSSDPNAVFEPFDLRLTKFMVVELVAGILMCVIFIRLAQKMRQSQSPKGRFWNMFEAMVMFVRNDIARSAIGKADGDKFVPFLLTMFFFILFCNLMGMLPWSGTPTAALGTTGVLALSTFAVVVGSASAKMGFGGFLRSQVPHMDLPGPMGFFLKPMIFVLEIGGMLIKHFVLSVRLLANMFAGHLVLAVILGFCIQVSGMLWFGVVPASILGAVALSLLELLVAFIQAYIFAFLSALFIGLAIHPH